MRCWGLWESRRFILRPRTDVRLEQVGFVPVSAISVPTCPEPSPDVETARWLRERG